MTKLQKLILWTATLILAVMWLFPPWFLHADWTPYRPGGIRIDLNPHFQPYTMTISYHCVFGPPESAESGNTFYIDWEKLLLSSAVLVLLSSTAFITTRPSQT